MQMDASERLSNAVAETEQALISLTTAYDELEDLTRTGVGMLGLVVQGLLASAILSVLASGRKKHQESNVDLCT